MKLAGKLILITGGSRGLGRDMALACAANGADLILTYHTKKAEAEEVCADARRLGRKATCLALDAGRIESFPEFSDAVAGQLESTFSRTSFDCLVNNAGIDGHSPFGTTTEAQFDALLNVHFKGVYFLIQTLLPRMSDGGAIVNLSTGLTRFAIPGYAPYAAMKGAIETLTKYLAKELGARRIRANVVAPGAIETDFTRPAFAHHPQLRDFIASQTALGRVGQPEDIGGVVAFLCSDESRWVNAQRIEASGGMFL